MSKNISTEVAQYEWREDKKRASTVGLMVETYLYGPVNTTVAATLLEYTFAGISRVLVQVEYAPPGDDRRMLPLLGVG